MTGDAHVEWRESAEWRRMPKASRKCESCRIGSASRRRLGKRIYKVSRRKRMTSGGPWALGLSSDGPVPTVVTGATALCNSTAATRAAPGSMPDDLFFERAEDSSSQNFRQLALPVLCSCP